MDLTGNRMTEWECVDWIQLAPDTDQWLSIVCRLITWRSAHFYHYFG